VRTSKAIASLVMMLWLVTIIFQPTLVLTLTVGICLLLKTKLKGLINNASIITRMIFRGIQNDYDIYHSNDLNTFPQGYFCAKYRFNRKPLIYDSHEVQTSRTGYNSSIYGHMEKFFVKKIDAMIVENHTRAEYNEKLYGFYPYVVHNYPFIQTESSLEKINLHQQLKLPYGEKILLYQGGIQTGRGLDKLILAVPQIKEGTLVLIGDGKIKTDLQRLVEEMELQEKVKFVPKVPLENLPKYTKNAYLGFQVLNNICFNHYSASSNKLYEYMMAGVPVVACDFPEIKRVVKGERTGNCIDSHDPSQIAKAVNQLLEDKKLHKELSENSGKASHKYNWEHEKQFFLDVYKF
jgi:glycosyltransferase involved in cell wall biosynthesis